MKVNRKGQALIEFGLIMPVLFGILALFVDVGFGQWRHIQAQAIAQSAAMSSAVNATTQIDLGCGSGVTCGSSSCPGATGNLAVGCQYGAIGSSATFKTTIQLTAGSGAPVGITLPASQYFVTATVHEVIMPIFGTGLNINAVSTAAVWISGESKGVFLVQ